MQKKWIIETSEELLKFLLNNNKSMSRNNIKSLLTNKKIIVNGKAISQYNYNLKKNDIVEISNVKNEINKLAKLLNIIYEDEHILVINKTAGLLTITTDQEKEKTAYFYASSYVKAKNEKNKIFIVHRLDKDTSGVLLFAKELDLKLELQDNWNEYVKARKYFAIVENKVTKKHGIIKTYLKESNTLKGYSTNNKNDKEAKLAITEYQVISAKDNLTLLDVTIKTGRKNQIRIHLSDMKNPVIGDKKYGSSINPINRLGLHAYLLEIFHPVLDKVLKFEAKKPSSFDTLM